MVPNYSDFTISNMTDGENQQIIQTLKNENAVLKKKLSIYQDSNPQLNIIEPEENETMDQFYSQQFGDQEQEEKQPESPAVAEVFPFLN